MRGIRGMVIVLPVLLLAIVMPSQEQPHHADRRKTQEMSLALSLHSVLTSIQKFLPSFHGVNHLRSLAAIQVTSENADSMSKTGKQLFAYNSARSATDDDGTAAHTFTTSDPRVHRTAGQWSREDDKKENMIQLTPKNTHVGGSPVHPIINNEVDDEVHNDDANARREITKEEKRQVKEELQEIRRQSKHAPDKKEQQQVISSEQAADIKIEANDAREGETELIDAWMKTPTYAPVESLKTMKEEAQLQRFVLNKYSGVNSKEEVARVKKKMATRPSPRRREFETLKEKYPLSHTFQYDYYRLYDKVKNITYGHDIPPNKYYLSLIAMFKNEASGMKEWLDHHIAHGVDHFYLVDDGSTDNPMQILQPYIDRKIVSMYPTVPRSIPFRQAGLYKKLFTEVYAANESKWVAMIDLDEYLYSPQEIDVRKILRRHEDLSVVGLNWVMFGSNGYKSQPRSIVQAFTRRADYNASKYPALLEHYKILEWHGGHYNDWQKYIINTAHKVDNIDIHTVAIEGTCDNLSYRRYPETPPLLLNHYLVQSEEWFMKIKSARGDVNNFDQTDTESPMAWFKTCDINDIKDDRLAKQNQASGLNHAIEVIEHII